MPDPTWSQMLRVCAWYAVFRVAIAAANQASLIELRVLLIEAIQAIDKAEEAGHGG